MAASATGPNRVPYCVYKGAPEAPMEAHDDCMDKRNNSDTTFTPKEKNGLTIGQFRPVSFFMQK